MAQALLTSAVAVRLTLAIKRFKREVKCKMPAGPAARKCHAEIEYKSITSGLILLRSASASGTERVGMGGPDLDNSRTC